MVLAVMLGVMGWRHRGDKIVGQDGFAGLVFCRIGLMILNKTHVYKATVDFDLLDAGNVVYHPNYLVLCERARSAALSEAGCSFQELWKQELALAVLECNAKYLRALELAQDLAILTRTTGATGSRIMVRQDILSASGLAPELSTAGFKTFPVEPQKREILFQVNFVLGSVKLRPLKATRHPPQLIQALGLLGACDTGT